MIIFGMIILLLPASGYSWNVSTIEKPEHRQKLYSGTVEIIVRFEDGANPETFKAWLNQKNISDKFEPIDNGMRALVGPEDGLRVFEETLETTRDDKGVWFITGSGKRGPVYRKGRNFLKTKIKGKKRRWDMDHKVFFLDMRAYDAFEAMGYAVATDRLWQGELYRRQARGRLAEIFGSDQLGTDVFMRTIGYSDEELQEGFEALNPEIRAIISGYAAGFNRRIAEIKTDISLLPFEFAVLGLTPRDWEVEDILAWLALLQRSFDPEALGQTQIDNASLFQTLLTEFPEGLEMFEDLRWINDPDALTYIPEEETATSGLMKMGSRPLFKKTHAFPANFGKAAKKMAKVRQNVVKNLKKINAFVKMGSYAWTVAGSKTASGNPIIYSGPQMGFTVPSIVLEGSIRAAGLNVSGMTVTGIPGIIIGRTPHHAWSMQVANAHTTDYYLEDPVNVSFHRYETIKVAGEDDVILPVWRTSHGPVINPMPYDPSTYVPNPANPIISWKYSHWGYEFNAAKGFIDLARAKNMNQFGAGIEHMAVSQHFCYADRRGNIGYWMSGRDPVRPVGEWRLPQGLLGPALEWDSALLIDRTTDRNTSQGFYGGWNNKSRAGYDSAPNATAKYFGPFNRAHVVDDYLRNNDNLTFEDLRDLAINIATTDSWEGGGNPWKFVKDDFITAVTDAGLTTERQAALDLLATWDGHFVDGGSSNWAWGTDRADAWVLMDAWIREVIRLTFEDELGTGAGGLFESQRTYMLFNVLLRGLAGSSAGLPWNYEDWFLNLLDSGAPQTADDIIVTALDTVLAGLGDRPWGKGMRGVIEYNHAMLDFLHEMPFSSRSTYAHCVEYGRWGPVQIESMFPLGESGNILVGGGGAPVFDANFFSMTPVYDDFSHRSFPLFD
jgi:penicillin G amidase